MQDPASVSSDDGCSSGCHQLWWLRAELLHQDVAMVTCCHGSMQQGPTPTTRNVSVYRACPIAGGGFKPSRTHLLAICMVTLTASMPCPGPNALLTASTAASNGGSTRPYTNTASQGNRCSKHNTRQLMIQMNSCCQSQQVNCVQQLRPCSYQACAYEAAGC